MNRHNPNKNLAKIWQGFRKWSVLKIQVIKMSKTDALTLPHAAPSFWLLWLESCDFSSWERKNDNYFHWKWSYVVFLTENGCHFVSLLSFASRYFFLSLRKTTWLNSQQPKTRGHVEVLIHYFVCKIFIASVFSSKQFFPKFSISNENNLQKHSDDSWCRYWLLK